MPEYIEREAAIDATYALHFKDSIQEALRNLPAADVRPVAELVQMIEEAIDATNMNDAYSIGLKNGLRCAKAFIDGKEPEYEKVSADVRPVVMCRDCIHARHYTNKIKCGYWSEQTASEIVGDDDFCSYGEKREES